MAVVVRMPSLAAGATEAAVQSWLIEVGDTVSVGQPIAEIETEKAIVEYEAESDGTLAGILVGAGDPARVGTPIAVLAAVGESAEDALREAGAMTDASAPGAARSAALAHHAPARHASTQDAPAARDEPPEPGVTSPPDGPRPDRLFASPLVRRLAREQGVDLQEIAGSGPGGRIVRRDLEAVLEGRVAASVSRATAPSGAVDIPHTPMRRAIARRLTESVTTIPQFTVSADCRADRLVALRAEVNVGRTAPVSLNDFVVKAVGAALADVPEANAIWTDDAIRRFSRADIGVAVALDGGLVTPVVHGVDALPLGELSTRLRDVAERARAGRLAQSELEGGSFAVSNLGMYGIREFAAIINPPQSGILAVGAAERRAVVTADGGIEAATIMTLTLTADHRVLDGALAARLLAAIVDHLESPVAMLV